MNATNSTTRNNPLKPTKRNVRLLVRKELKKRSPSGYSLDVPDDGVMFVSDGVKNEHNRWYVQVVAEPEYIIDTRRQEYLGILSEVQEFFHKKYNWTVYLTSMLPTV